MIYHCIRATTLIGDGVSAQDILYDNIDNSNCK